MPGNKIHSRVLGQHLRRLRRERGVQSTQAMEKLMGCKYSYSNISRRENGKLNISFEYLADFCKALRMSTRETNRMMALAQVSQLRPESQAEMAVATWTKIALEGSHYQYYNENIVCYYLQTRDYMKSVVSLDDDPPRNIEKTVELRLQNASAAFLDGTRQFRILLHENALYCDIGSPRVMLEQLGQLLSFVDQPRAEFRVLPRGTFLPVNLWHSFYIVDHEFSFSENRLDFSISNDEAVVSRHQSDFNLLWANSVIGIRRNEIIQRAMEHYQKLKSRA